MNLTSNLWNYTLPSTLRTPVCSSWFHYLSPPLDRCNNNSISLCSLFFCFYSINSFVHYTWTLICIFFWFWIDIFIVCGLWFSFLLSILLMYVSLISFSIIHQHLNTPEHTYLPYCSWAFGLLIFFAITRQCRVISSFVRFIYLELEFLKSLDGNVKIQKVISNSFPKNLFQHTLQNTACESYHCWIYLSIFSTARLNSHSGGWNIISLCLIYLFLIKNEVEGISMFVSHIYFPYYKISLYLLLIFSIILLSSCWFIGILFGMDINNIFIMILIKYLLPLCDFSFSLLSGCFWRMEVVKLNVIRFLSLYSALLWCELSVYCIKYLLYPTSVGSSFHILL